MCVVKLVELQIDCQQERKGGKGRESKISDKLCKKAEVANVTCKGRLLNEKQLNKTLSALLGGENYAREKFMPDLILSKLNLNTVE